MARIRRIGVWQSSKLVAAIYFVITAIILLPVGLIGLAAGVFDAGSSPVSGFLAVLCALLLPALYAALAFVSVALFCWVYNVVAGLVGGIELDLDLS